MDVQATGEAFIPQIEHTALQNMKIINFLKNIFDGHFYPPGSGSGLRIRIQIH